MIFLWIRFTIGVSNFENLLYYIREYADCMAGGVRDGLDCGEFKRNFETVNIKYFEATNVAMYAFLNLTYLPFVLSYRTVKKSVIRFLSSLNNMNTIS